ncbi:L,D-transpeptidase family protein [Argonema antarcticum]|uniref:L,D-transpeptidase family protein n=1 Tax=Argonema antarcticum TaxID=2942763 RepID=UPI002011FAFC|nr:L,D-transpeptidase [Argonema antarcticum]MCL1473871.1 L,D-transpeptidase [Argonema antarcticum A004/B2]
MVVKKTQSNRRRTLLSLSVLLIVIVCLYSQLTRLGYAVPLPYLLDVLCLTGCDDDSSANITHPRLADNQLLNYDKQITQILGKDKNDKNKISILIEKSKYRLIIYYDKQPVKSYPVVFGANPVDDKLKEGDKRTPEGRFKIKDLYPHPAWSKFLWLDYPNKYSWRKHFQAKLSGKINWDNSIGGEIGIHGTPNDDFIQKGSNWTLGCISLKNQDVDEIYRFVQQGTEVEIIR